jgi:glycosyltransferase involved in cell wall biosynthesis
MTAISVIIPSYNCAPFLGDSLESILRQATPDTEVLVVDDGSTDDTPAVLARYADRVRVVHGTHGGYAAARNLGLAHARGEWIAWHDADDVALPDRLARQRELLAARPWLDGIVCNGRHLETDTPIVPPRLVRRCAGKRLGPEDMFAGLPLYLQAALVRRSAFAASGSFDTDLRIYADMEYGYRLFVRAHLEFVDVPVFLYRTHPGNVTRDRLRGREEIVRVLEDLERAHGESALRIGVRRLHARLARHYYQLARTRLRAGDDSGRAALARAIALRPLHPRYRLFQWLAA